MSNNLLLLICFITAAFWIAQELISRKMSRAKVSAFLKVDSVELPAEERVKIWQRFIVPVWMQKMSHALVLAWWGWAGWLIINKDGDFPLILVMLTFMAGVVWAADKWFFSNRRHRLLDADSLPEVSNLADKEEVKQILLSEMPAAETAKSFFPILILVLVLRSFVVEPFKIPSTSMVPTLLVNDFILVNKFSYGLRLPVIRTKILTMGDPRRGDVMVFFPPHDDRYFIKRVIGLPGDEIRYVNNVLYLNGEEMPQKLVAGIPPEAPTRFLMEETLLDGFTHMMKKNLKPNQLAILDKPYVVPEGHYFMMGDNRDNSSDSRIWGAVPEKNIVGKAFAIWVHWGSLFSLPKFDRNGKIN